MSYDCEDAWKFVIDAIVSNPCIVSWNSKKHFYVQSNFCTKGMGFVGMQPTYDKVSIAAMARDMAGGPCKFMRDPPKDNPKIETSQLRHVCFDSRRCKGYKRNLHSYLDEGFPGDWALGKHHHYL